MTKEPNHENNQLSVFEKAFCITMMILFVIGCTTALGGFMFATFYAIDKFY